MTGTRVVYNGHEMSAEWPARIEAAQEIEHYVIGDKAYRRIAYGDEEGHPSGGPCHDCGVLPGQLHVEFVCDMERRTGWPRGCRASSVDASSSL